MQRVLQLTRRLTARPKVSGLAGIRIRHFDEGRDCEPVIGLRTAAFSTEAFAVRPWTYPDLAEQLLRKEWWRAEHMWLAENEACAAPHLLGMVILAFRGRHKNARPVVHWLCVHPDWRRRGIGRLLMAHLEAACWNDGYRQIWLETHVAWGAAFRFYTMLGYESVQPGKNAGAKRT